MAFTEDKSVFFDTDGFAITGSYTPAGYPHPSVVTNAALNGIHDHRYVETEKIQGERPVFLIDEDIISKYTEGDQLTLNETIYTLADWQKTGNGMMLLILSENDT